jgi:hypothetical protein
MSLLALESVITCPNCGTRSIENDANGRVRVLSRLFRLRQSCEAQGGRLLCVLQLRQRAVPAHPGATRLLRIEVQSI